MKYTKEFLEPLVANSKSIRQILTILGITSSGSMYKLIADRIRAYGLSTDHFEHSVITYSKRTWKEILITRQSGGRQTAYRLRRALIESGREYKCILCDNPGIWQSKKLVLQVDHINGDIINDSPDNLRFLCPNCHTQTDGYGGSKGLSNIISVTCLKKRKMGAEIHKSKIDWPSDDDLSILVWKIPSSHLADELGVSDSALSKRCRNRSISKPPIGYWSGRNRKQATKGSIPSTRSVKHTAEDTPCVYEK